jgi:DnaJ homolog subfamily C member 7
MDQNNSPADPVASSSSGSSSPDISSQEEAEKIKEQGNVAFKAKRYGEAIDFYTRAIDLYGGEPAYYTNRAASYMAIKRFRTALADCQTAARLQAEAPSAKTLVRLARCQLALGSPTPALSTLRDALSAEPNNSAALALQKKVLELEAHLRNFENARSRKEWGMARLALGKCLQGIEGEGGEIPIEWRLWGVELELARGNWDAANIAAKYGFLRNFL